MVIFVFVFVHLIQSISNVYLMLYYVILYYAISDIILCCIYYNIIYIQAESENLEILKVL